MDTTGDPQPPPAMTPPTERGDPPERRAGWPTVIGIIAIVFGAMGLVSNVSVAIWGGPMPAMPPELQKARLEVMRA